jgi:glycosyltransferase involved in cell wall biosynthesis
MKLSVIVAVHNEALNIRPFYERAVPVLDSLGGLSAWEIIYVNDASQDDSLAEIFKLRAADSRVKVITLSRRFGYHSVLVAGLSQADSDLYAMVDVDCEDPPELLAQFYAAIQGGVEVAYGVRSNREEPAFITFMRKLFYYANKWIADSEIIVWMAEFAMITRQVRDAILTPHTTYPFLRAEIGFAGFKRAGLSYFRAKRSHGRTHYNIFRMTRFAVAGILSSSTFFLRFVLYAAAFLGVLFPVWVVLAGLTLDQAAKLATILGFYFLMVTMPIIALYLARTYKNGVARPVFIIDKKQTFL